jgi:predicted PurR-regulated permease PerM
MPPPSSFRYASLTLALLALWGVLQFNLLVALLAGCATYALTNALPHTWLLRRTGHRAQVVASCVVAALPVLALVGAGLSLAYLGAHAPAAYEGMLHELGRVLDQWRDKLPEALAAHLPADAAALKPWVGDLVRSQAEKLTAFGKTGAHGLLMVVVGVVVGLLLANSAPSEQSAPLSRAISDRARRLQASFTAIVAAQFWIAIINTALTAAFFYLVLPMFDVKMPYAAMLLALTFFAGMLPVVGNLLCNTVTTIAALTVGPFVAVSALGFLVLVHKLEYVISAKVVGSRAQLAVWELLAAMFAFEAMFGIAGLVAAPFFYSYLKHELRELNWV